MQFLSGYGEEVGPNIEHAPLSQFTFRASVSLEPYPTVFFYEKISVAHQKALLPLIGGNPSSTFGSRRLLRKQDIL